MSNIRKLLIFFRLVEMSDGNQIAKMYYFPYLLNKSLDPEILAGEPSYYDSKSIVRFLASRNMVSHGGLTDLSIGVEDPNYLIVIGKLFHI